MLLYMPVVMPSDDHKPFSHLLNPCVASKGATFRELNSTVLRRPVSQQLQPPCLSHPQMRHSSAALFPSAMNMLEFICYHYNFSTLNS